MNTDHHHPSLDVNGLESVWEAAWRDLGLLMPTDAGVYQRLLTAYAEPQRHYHSLQHLGECLTHFQAVRHLAAHPGEVALALWFHDAVYDPKGKDNEALSARWADEVLAQAGATQPCRDRVQALIMATCHQANPTEADAQLLVDIDLAILGSAPARFDEYDRQVRQEYRWVPGFVYRRKRREVLRSFLDRQHIYSTERFRQSHEAQARLNLTRAVSGR